MLDDSSLFLLDGLDFLESIVFRSNHGEAKVAFMR